MPALLRFGWSANQSIRTASMHRAQEYHTKAKLGEGRRDSFIQSSGSTKKRLRETTINNIANAADISRANPNMKASGVYFSFTPLRRACIKACKKLRFALFNLSLCSYDFDNSSAYVSQNLIFRPLTASRATGPLRNFIWS